MLTTKILRALTAGAATAALVAGCGGDDDTAGAAKPESTAPSFKAGAVVFEDAFEAKANKDGWLLVDGVVSFEKGRYIWLEMPEEGASSLPDTLLKREIPAGIAASVDVEMTGGSALRGLRCREQGEDDPEAWYELGVDGERAQIRKMSLDAPPQILKATEAPLPNGRKVRLTAHCVPDAGGSLVLALSTDGKEIVRATDADPVEGAPGTVALFGYARPDSDGPANLAWDDFELRAATAG